MSNKKTGGPAFGEFEKCGDVAIRTGGMTLRDYFAAKAMQAMIGTANGPCLNGLDKYEPVTAKAAYLMADAMLEARNND